VLNLIRGPVLGLLAAGTLAGAALAQAPASPVPGSLAVTEGRPAPGATAPVEAPGQPAPKAQDIVHLAAQPGLGQPVDGGVRLQPQVTEVGQEAARMHNYILEPFMAAVSLLVLLLLLWVIVRYRAAANPTPSRTSHNTAIEVIWTLAPVLILVAVAVPSIKLIAHQYSPPKADLTVKAIGNQWYWDYQYPDHGGFEIVSNMLKEPGETTGKERPRTDADGPPLLAVDERMVVPTDSTVKIISTSADVIHSFAMPAFWTKMDAVPGRLNETWFHTPKQPGVFFGQCSELCGARHAFMPIVIEVVRPEQFAQWVAFKGGTMPTRGRPAASPDATRPDSPAVAGSAAASLPAGGETPTEGVATPPVSDQSATAQNQGSQKQ